MSEWTSIPAASGLTTLSAADEAGTGTGSDLSRGFLGLAGFLGFLGFFRLFVWDDHGCLRFADAGGETTRRREPRGVSGTFEVSPTGSIPRRENPAWQVTNDKVEASRAMLNVGQKAPEVIRPLTRVARPQSRDKCEQNQILPNHSSRAVRAPPKAARPVPPPLR